jgi:transposase IS66 family protein/transposase IS66-like protein
LYAVEGTARERGLEGEELRLPREHGSRPILERLHVYLHQIRDQVLPKSEVGQAVAYTLKNWTALARYCEDPDLSIDNNATERALRCFAVGRANWTFFGTDRGGKTAAVLRSFVTSCELVKLDPFAWFRDVLSRIADHSMSKLDGTPASSLGSGLFFLLVGRLDSQEQLIPLMMFTRGTASSAAKSSSQQTDVRNQIDLHPAPIRKWAAAEASDLISKEFDPVVVRLDDSRFFLVNQLN